MFSENAFIFWIYEPFLLSAKRKADKHNRFMYFFSVRFV